MLRKILLASLAVAAVFAVRKSELWDLLPSNTFAGRQANDAYLVASEQLIRPWRLKAQIKGRPADISIDPASRFAAVLNGTSVVLLDLASGAELSRVTTRTTSYLGIVFRPGAQEIWASEATRNGPDSLLRIPYQDNGKLGPLERIELKGHPIPAGLAFTPDGNTLYAALHHDNQILVLDARSKREIARWSTGLAPFALALNQQTLYVSNRAGAPRASAKQAPSGKQPLPTGDTGSVLNGSVQIFDTATGTATSIDAGLAPAGIALSPGGGELVIANAHGDTLSILDTRTRQVTTLPIDKETSLPGLLPNFAAFRRDGARFYVACGGENSVAVFDRDKSSWKRAGKIPTGWFPTALAVDAANTIHVASVKGIGNDEQSPGKHSSRAFEGTLSSIPDPSASQLAAGAREVNAARKPVFTAHGGVRGLDKLGIEHVFFLIKENRTYDQVFSDIPKGKRDESLLMYGREVTPNHHELAEQYVLLDNFYSSGAISFEGHQWLMMGFVSDHVERALQAAPRGYAWNMGDALTVSPAGFFWQDRKRPLSVRLLGPVSEPATPGPDGLMRDINETEMLKWSEYWDHYKKGTWRTVIGSRCVVPALKPVFDEKFPPSSMKVPDQIRAEAFAERLDNWERNRSTPNLVIMTMTSDHTEGRNPAAPRPRSMLADNDYALGRIVEEISKSSLWSKSLILVVEDDAQDGVDHVSGRRTLALAIGPHIKRGVLDSNHYTHISMVRTIQDIFRIPPKTLYLANARAMNSVFQPNAKPEPYTAIEPKIRLDDMNPPATALKGREKWAALESAKMNWHDLDDVPSDTLNRILWGDAKGWDKPYPGRIRSGYAPAAP
ncbi:MAG: bifunctional YncE family protein/alkaline phosphatase family protein [Acidobacteria bacterium]|nr:bifunctional YncE family protein/alkaline phosphatase family protein [Acidobacteriota bacterium]